MSQSALPKPAFLAALFLILSIFGANAACYSETQALPQADVDAFVANPAQLLQQNSDGGPTMISRVRDLAASNPSTLQAILGLISTANSNQRVAIGTGLGQAAQVCVRTDGTYASEIQRSVGQTGAPDVIAAIASVLGDAPIGALGGGGGGLSAGAGGPINSNASQQFGNSTLQTFGTSRTTNSFTGFTAPGSSTPGSSTTTSTIVQSTSTF
ncbi:hypothetical protein [Bradyrhizobium guangdongense]|uniref:hypothetical protein n=1 Tax=Bradyrhizobium guangdongense TaxID=1325090 RepID=UPI001127C165|nr:hypothetical protein [Bradyrhizobium guangdongense]